MRADCDDPDYWRALCLNAVIYGASDGKHERPPITERALLEKLRADMNHYFGYRNGHLRHLRTVYGGAYNGTKLTRRAKEHGR